MTSIGCCCGHHDPPLPLAVTHSAVPGAEALASGKQGGDRKACALTLLCLRGCPGEAELAPSLTAPPGDSSRLLAGRCWFVTLRARVGVARPPFLGTSEPHLPPISLQAGSALFKIFIVVKML